MPVCSFSSIKTQSRCEGTQNKMLERYSESDPDPGTRSPQFKHPHTQGLPLYGGLAPLVTPVPHSPLPEWLSARTVSPPWSSALETRKIDKAPAFIQFTFGCVCTKQNNSKTANKIHRELPMAVNCLVWRKWTFVGLPLKDYLWGSARLRV